MSNYNDFLKFDAGSPGETTRVLCEQFINLKKQYSLNNTDAIDKIIEIRFLQLGALIPEVLSQENIDEVKKLCRNSITTIVLIDFLFTRNFRKNPNKDLIEKNIDVILEVIAEEFKKFSKNTATELLMEKLKRNYVKITEGDLNIYNSITPLTGSEEIFYFHQPYQRHHFNYNHYIPELIIKITTSYIEFNLTKINLKDIASFKATSNYKNIYKMLRDYSFDFIDFSDQKYHLNHRTSVLAEGSGIIDQFPEAYEEFVEIMNNTIFLTSYKNYLEKASKEFVSIGPVKFNMSGVYLTQNLIFSKRVKFVNWNNIEICPYHEYRIKEKNSINTSLSTGDITQWQYNILKKFQQPFYNSQ